MVAVEFVLLPDAGCAEAGGGAVALAGLPLEASSGHSACGGVRPWKALRGRCD